MRKSTDLGVTFGTPVTVASSLTGPQVNGGLGLTGIRNGLGFASVFRSNSFPHAAVNPVSGDIYLTYNDNPDGPDKGDIFMVMSTDGGSTWSAPTRINDDGGTTDQWQPTVAVSPDGNNIGIFYCSREGDGANNLYTYNGRNGIISGSSITFLPSYVISDVMSLPEFGRDGIVNSRYMGDYNQAAATNTDFHLVWSDNRDDLAGGGDRKDPNVYYKSIPFGLLADANISVNPSAVTFGLVGVNTIGGPIALTITNIGDADLTVSAISDPDPDFSISTPALPAVIPSLGTITVDVSFSPTSIGLQNSSVTITSDALNDPSLVVNLTGQGTVENDICGDAIAVDCNTTVSGSTLSATLDTDVTGTSCGTSINAPGVWYTVEGVGANITASTCNQADYDTKISVFTGDCELLTCVGGQDDFPGCSGFTTEFTWASEANTTYYILVHGFGGQTGNFDLTVTCEVPAEITVSPDEFTFLVPLDGNDADLMSITNSGASGAINLDWTVNKSEVAPFGPGGGYLSGQQDIPQSFVIHDETLMMLSSGNMPHGLVTSLQPLINRSYTDKDYFGEILQRTLGEENYRAHGVKIMESALQWQNPNPYIESQTMADKYAQLEKDKEETNLHAPMDAGGPDTFGYVFIDSNEPDGPTFSWTDITATGTEIISNGDWDFALFGNADDAYKVVTLPFTFNFYGIAQTEVKVSSNGYLTFGTDGTNFSNDPIPNPTVPNDIICPFWDDLNPAGAGTIHYQSSSDQLIVQYTGLPRFGEPLTSLTFQVILNSDGSMLYQYQDMQGTITSGTVGIENSDASSGLQVAFNTTYVQNNLAVLIQEVCPWLTFGPPSGSTPQGNTDDVNVNVDAAGLDIDTYLCNMVINSNGINENPVIVPVIMVVGTPVERIDALIAKVEALEDAGVLNKGQANALIVKLEAAKKSLNKGKCQTAVNQLNAFINQVTAFINGGILTQEQGDELIADANAIIDILSPCEESKSGELLSDVSSGDGEMGFTLEQNRPNPFNGKTTISFSVAEANHTTLVVYNAVGQEVAVLFNEVAAEEMQYSVEFDGSQHPKGIYFYRLESGEKVQTMKKMILMR
jgi:hypothetical protein